jgi:hypothetical protein
MQAETNTFKGSGIVGVSLESGRTDLQGIQVDFLGRRPYENGSAVSVAVKFTYATTQAEVPGSPRIIVADRFAASFAVEQNLSEHAVMMFLTEGLRDSIAQIDYRIGELAGVGARLGGKRVKIRVVPGIAFFQVDKNIQDGKGFQVDYGLYQDMAVTLSSAWTLIEHIGAARNITKSRDYIVSGEVKLHGDITKHVGMQFSYEYNFERLEPPGIDPEYQKTIAGLQISF